MKKILVTILIIIAIIISFVIGIKLGENPNLLKGEIKNEYPYDGNDLYAIENLGYNYKDSSKLVEAGAFFLDLGGDEYYYIEPRYDQTKINIYKNDINNEESELILSTITQKAVVVKCNESDIFSNVTIELITNEGKTTKFSPYISLKDGTLVINEEGFFIKK